MLETIQNEFLTVQVNTLGAELASVKTRDGAERLWQGDPALWNRRAPNLFPIIGRLRDNRYQWEGETYQISNHGFARDLPFTVTERGAEAITLALEDSPETRERYPFAFRLEISYRLEGRTLQKSHRIVNRSDREMPYELGGHDGWNTSLFLGERMSDYWLEFPGLEALEPFVMDRESCFLHRERIRLPLAQGRYALPPDTAGMDTVVLSGVRQVTLGGPRGPLLRLSCPEYPYLALWTTDKAAETNYICLEPWTTLPECDYTGPDLREKVGIRLLPPGGEERFSYSLELL